MGEWRAKHDPVAVRGIPAHITALFPFVPPGELTKAVLDQLSLLCSTLQPFEYELVEIDRFPEAVWLRPSPDDEFRSLTRSIWRAFPDFPPYGGQFPDSQPHLTVAKLAESRQDGFVRQLTEAINDRLPVACVASAVSVFVSDGDGVWDRQHRFPLGVAD